MKKQLGTYLKLIGWAISLLLIALSVFYFDWAKIWAVLRIINYWYLPLLFLIYLIDFYIRAYRWKIILYPIQPRASITKLFYSYNIAYFSNIFLPARLGELFRVMITAKEEDLSRRTVLGTLFIERVFDLLGMGTITFGTLIFIGHYQMDIETHTTLLLWSIVFVSIFFTAVAVILIIKRLDLLKLRISLLGRLFEVAEPFYNGMISVHRAPVLLLLTSISLFMWLFNSFILYIYIKALAIDASFLDTIVILLFQLLGEFIPSAPSSVGTFHASTVIGCKLVGLSVDQGMALGMLNHFVDLIIRAIVGIGSIHFMRFDYRKAIQLVQNESVSL